jgi:hypothetical protein
MMRFGLYSMIAILSVILLLPALVLAQDAAPAQQNPPAGAAPTDTSDADQENAQSAVIEPVMSGPYPVMSQAALARGRQIFEMFSKTETGQMWASLSEGLRKQSGTETRFVELNKKLRTRMGAETQMLEENMVPFGMAPDTVYSRLSNYANTRVPVMAVITFNQKGQIDAFSINPIPLVAEGPYAGYQDTAKLKLPFSGEWLVYLGGRNLFENAYAQSDDTRFAMDFVYLKDKKLFSGKGGIGSKDTDYYCFGQPILAPADGTVVKAQAGYNDNEPGKPTGDQADGNIVTISHGNGETSVINHLKQNSLKVKRGDTVKQGDVIAECGNSGGSTIPHLHYQLQKSPGVLLPAQFVDYIADGKPVDSGEPKRGQLVKNATSTEATTAPASNTKKTASK